MSDRLSFRDGPFFQLLLARLREFIRKPEAVFWVYVFPLLMVLSLGAAFRSRPMERFVVQGPATISPGSPLAALQEDPRIDLRTDDAATARARLRAGKADLLLEPREDGSVAYQFDPTKPSAVLARNVVDDLLQRRAGRQDVMANEDVELNEPGGRYVDFLVPGLLGMGLLGGGLWGVGFAIVDMRIRKVLKLFLATPMRRSDFMAALMASRLLFTVSEIVLLLVFARLVFGVVVHGNYLIMLGLILLGAIQFSGLGMLVASRAQTLEAVSGLMNLVMLPMWIFSGIFFSTERFPEFAQPLISVLPLTPVIRALRAVMLEGAGWWDVWPNLLIMSVWAALSFAIALKIFRWN